MAGPFSGVLLGTIGTRPGTSNMSPYLAMRQMQIEAEQRAQAQQQQQGQFDATMGERQQEFASSQEQAKAEMDFKQREADRAKSRYEMEFINREQQQKQQADMQKTELDIRAQDQASLAKSREDKNLQDKAEFDAKQTAEKTAKQDETNMADVYTQARSIIAQRVPVLQQAIGAGVNGTGATPEAIRDALLSELDTVDVTPQEKAVMQKAVDEWYKSEQAKKQADLATQREERIAQNEKADLEIKQRQIESYDNAKKMQAAQAASAPYRRQQENIVKQINDLDVKLATLEGVAQNAPPDRAPFYQNALTGLRSAKERLKARYDELEAQASAREAEVLAKG